MGVYRSYFNKNTTLISDSKINTGNNPVSELFYGINFSRFIFDVDLSNLQQLVNDKTIILKRGVTHTLKIKNTIHDDVSPYLSYENKLQFEDKARTISYDLELVPLDEAWDEGRGYDFTYINDTIEGNRSFVTEPANWHNRQTNTGWSYSGAVNPNYSAITSEHFSAEAEDVSFDITDFVNELLQNNMQFSGTTGLTPFHGFCLKYTDELENLIENKKQYVGFLTNKTQTFFQPHIETVYTDTIIDDRNFFYLNKTNRLFLYVNKSERPVNLDQKPTVEIQGSTFTAEQATKGAYYIDATFTNLTTYTEYNDVWKNLKLDGNDIPNKILSFVPKPYDQYFQIGNEVYEPKSYEFSMYGIKEFERIVKGEIRKIRLIVREPYTVNKQIAVDEIYYRVYVKQGPNHVNVVDWHKVNRANNQNYIILNTGWMLPQKYYIDIKIVNNSEVNIYSEETTFFVVAQKGFINEI